MGKISEKMKFIKGMDVSTLLELEKLGAKFQDEDGDERDECYPVASLEPSIFSTGRTLWRRHE